jgi:hypothetical protein
MERLFKRVNSLVGVARKNPDLQIITVSPGSMDGKSASDELNTFMRFLMKIAGIHLNRVTCSESLSEGMKSTRNAGVTD